MSQVLDAATTTDEVVALGRQVRELVADRGVTTSDGTRERPWRLDPIPWRIPESEWTALAAGVAQRTELLDAILADLYGARRLLRSGLLPPRLVLGDAGFLPAVDEVRLPGPRQLVLSATDLARTADGWQVISDRAQAPSGAGYAMEGRRIVSQIEPGTYRQAGVLRVGPYFQALRDALHAGAPASTDEPRVAILTPGPRSATAFDEGFHAGHLGVPLVNGRDLMVREGRVWLRGLAGLEPIDVLWRRLDAAHCDPLDLLRGSRLGVPGLVRAVRGGGVSVVNPLGAGVLENPGLAAYLPGVCRAMRDEELALPSTTTYWCGDPSALSHVQAHLDDLVVRSTDRTSGTSPLHGWELSAAQRTELVARITADPERWVAQEPVHPDRLPTLVGGTVRDRSVVLRTFAVASDDGYRLMPGGLALTSPADVAAPFLTPASGAIAKDVWVTATSPSAEDENGPDTGGHWAELVALAPEAETAQPAALRALVDGAPPALSPRAAESLFWLGRYSERAAGNVRLLRVVQDRHRDFQHRPLTPGGVALGVLTAVLDDSTVPGGPAVLMGHRDLDGTIAADVDRVVACCYDVRDQMPADTWLATSALERVIDACDADAEQPAPPLHEALDAVSEGLLALAGISAESLVRDIGWHLLRAGRHLERALSLARTLLVAAAPRPEPVESLLLDGVLVVHDSVLTYRRRHRNRPELASVLALLLLDRANPRSLAAQVDALRESFSHVPGDAARLDLRERLLGDLDDLLTEVDPRALASSGTDVDADGTHSTDEAARTPPAENERHGQGEAPTTRTRLADLLESVAWRLEELGEDTTRLVTPDSASLDLDAADTVDTIDADSGKPHSPQDPQDLG